MRRIVTSESIIKRFQKKPKVLFIQGSARHSNNCPDQKPKSKKIQEAVVEAVGGECLVDVLDL